MNSHELICPNCNFNLPITEAIKTLAATMYQADAKALQADYGKRARELEKQKLDLEKQKGDIDLVVQERLTQEKATLSKAIQAEVEKKKEMEFMELATRLAEREKLINERNKNELELRRQLRELEEKDKNAEIEYEKRISEERKKVEETITLKIAAEYEKNLSERDFKENELRKQVAELKRKLEQGSQQLQGEALESSVEDILKRLCPDDVIQPIGKGVRGGDILQTVNLAPGNACGSILWEAKRTKAFSNSWIEKLKEDVREAEATIGVIITDVMPKNCRLMAHIDGVWIIEPQALIGFVVLVRKGMIDLRSQEIVSSGVMQKSEILYQYLTGLKFRQRIETIVEAFGTLKTELEKERKVMLKSWQVRERQIESVLINTVGIYGDVQGIVGLNKLTIPALEHVE